jgi:hypothetical protein
VHEELNVKGTRLLDEFWVVTLFAAIAGDVLTGAVRYYTALAGVAPLAYAPKLMMVLCMVLIVVNRPRVSHLLVVLFMAAATCVALANGRSLSAAGFWFWTISPVFFAALAPPDALRMLERPRARMAFVGLGVLCAVGVLVNYFVALPWVGTSVSVGGVDVGVSAASWVGDARRLSGFGRASSSTGLMLGLLATWLLPRFRSPVATALLLIGGGVAIWGTTNKTTLVSLAFVLVLSRYGRLFSVRKACMWAAAVTVVFPFLAYATVVAHGTTALDSGVLYSFEDRIFNTWPLILQAMVKDNLLWFGLGPGGFGAVTIFYPSSAGFNVLYADNMALYVMATFGLVGTILGSFLMAKLLISLEAESSPAWIMLFFLLSSGVTTDIFESVGCLVFLGVTIKALWLSNATQAAPLWLEHPYEASPVRRGFSVTTARRQ